MICRRRCRVWASLREISVGQSGTGTGFYLYFCFLHVILVSPLLRTFNILPPLFAAAPSNTTDAHWETGESERKKNTFLALKSVYAFGNGKVWVCVCVNPALRNEIHK